MDTVATKTKMNLGMYAYSKSSIEEISRIRQRNSFNPDVGTGDESDAGAQETTPILEQQKKRFGACGLVWSIAVKSIVRTWSSNRQVPALQHPHVRETGNNKVQSTCTLQGVIRLRARSTCFRVSSCSPSPSVRIFYHSPRRSGSPS